MIRIDENSWPAVEPVADFAHTTVDQMLRHSSGVKSPAMQPRHWIGLLAAALLATGAAWGWVHRTGHRAGSNAQAVASTLSTLATPSMRWRVPPRAMPRIPQLNLEPTSRASIKPARMPLEPPLAPSRIPKVPACQCERGFSDFICDCY
jgi:hypothetical protein